MYLWNSAEGPHPKGRALSGCYRLHQQRPRQLKWRASGGSERERRGPSKSTRRERRSGTDRNAKHTDPASGRRRSGVKQPDS